LHSSPKPSPKVSIGLPVYNGENYIAEAIQLILAQTYTDFELIISDNASTDNTAEICAYFIAIDSRIHYFRNSENLGAGRNYDICFHKSRGEYFKWAAHDDMIRDDFLIETVTLLDNNPKAVLCGFNPEIVSANGTPKRTILVHKTSFASEQPSVRYKTAVNNGMLWLYFFGLFRRSALVGSQLHGTFQASDQALLAEIVLRGHFIQSDESIFRFRRHKNNYSTSTYKDRKAAGIWIDTRNKKKNCYLRLTYITMLLRGILKSKISFTEKMLCTRVVFKKISTHRIRKELLQDFRYMLTPRKFYKD
jgi:glycosyltransferase involved in cell wall biosynthesis